MSAEEKEPRRWVVALWKNPLFDGSDEGECVDRVGVRDIDGAFTLAQKWLDEDENRKVEIIHADAITLMPMFD